MDNRPLVSIIMNCYNGEEFLQESLESIQNQAYEKWELIFWDNQSIDNSSTIFKSFNDPRFQYFYAPEHLNLYEARGLAIKESKGDLISFLDTDDTWESNKLDLQIPLFNDSSVALVYGNYWVYDQKSRKKKVIYNELLPSGNIVRDLLNKYVVGLLTIIFRRHAYDNLNKQFDKRFPMCGDFDLVIRLALNNDFAVVQRPIATYRWHDNNSSKKYLLKQIEELELWLEEMSVNDQFSTFKELSSIKNNLTYLKGKQLIENKNYIKSLKYFIKLPICYNKLKLLFIIVMPKFVVRWFTLLKN